MLPCLVGVGHMWPTSSQLRTTMANAGQYLAVFGQYRPNLSPNLTKFGRPCSCVVYQTLPNYVRTSGMGATTYSKCRRLLGLMIKCTCALRAPGAQLGKMRLNEGVALAKTGRAPAAPRTPPRRRRRLRVVVVRSRGGTSWGASARAQRCLPQCQERPPSGPYGGSCASR